MGIEIIRLGNTQNIPAEGAKLSDLSKISFQNHVIPDPPMSIWIMSLQTNKLIFPWWSYAPTMDDDTESMKNTWGVSNAQQLFDCLFLYQLHRFAGNKLFAIFPGNAKSNAWGQLRETDKATFMRGQGCVYHLEGSYKSSMSINWVPFHQPQSMVRRPRFDEMWRIFSCNQDENNDVNCLTLFSLSDVRLLPEITNLVTSQDAERSQKLASLVDWFGVYSSPLKPEFATSAVLYTKNKNVVPELAKVETTIKDQFAQAQKELIENPVPRTVMRLLNRSLVL